MSSSIALPVRDTRLLLAVLLPNIFWSPVNLVLQVALEGGFTPAALAGCRWALLAVLLVPLSLAMRKRAPWPSKRDILGAFLVGLFFFGPAHAIYYSALSRTSSFEATALGTTAPVWTALLAFAALGERADPRRIIGLLLGVVGAYGVSVGWQVPNFSDGNQAGNALFLLGVVTESVAGVAATRIVRRSSGLGTLTFQTIGAACAFPILTTLFPAALAWQIQSPTTAALGSLAYLVVVAGLFNFGVWYTLAERAPLSWLVVTLLLQPPLSLVWGMAFRGEQPTIGALSGTVLILSGLAVASLGRTSRKEVSGEQSPQHGDG